jgi:membrane-associated phospholipid phosphatase
MERLSKTFSLNPSKLVHTSIIIRTLAFLLIIFCIPLESIVSNELIDWQEDWVLDLQKDYRSDSLDSFAQGMMFLGDHWVILLISPFIFHFIDTRLSLKAILFFCYSVYLQSMAALLTREPRPFWVKEEISGINCERGFGSPSKETMLGISVYTVLCIEYFHSFKLWVRVIVYSSVIVLQIVLGASAIYLGAHFPHQVLMSAIYAIIYLTTCFAFDKQFTKIVLRSGFSYHKNRMSIVYWFIATVVMLLTAVTIFDIIAFSNPMNLKWLREASVLSK